MYLSWSRIATLTLTHAQHWDNALGSCLIQHLLYLSLSCMWILLPQDLLVLHWKKSLTQEYSPRLYWTFSFHSNPPSKILSVVQSDLFCKNKDIPSWAFLHQFFLLSTLMVNSWQQHVNCSLLDSEIWLRDKKYFQPHSHECSGKNQISHSRTHLKDEVLCICLGGGHLE